jgi:hypothetical protein
MKTLLILLGAGTASYFGYTYAVKKGYITDFVGNALKPKTPGVTPSKPILIIDPARKPLLIHPAPILNVGLVTKGQASVVS